MAAFFRRAERTFDSLLDCSTYLGNHFLNPKRLDEPVRFLFRGESRSYPTTRSTIERVPAAMRIRLDGILSLVLTELSQSLAKVTRATAANGNSLGFAQHYGVPTTMIDFTSNPLVAAYFAMKGRGRYGLIGVLDCEIAGHSAAVVDLRQDELAKRARTQHAFALSGYAEDLKSHAAKNELGIQWYRVRILRDDRRAFREMAYLEDAHFDVTAGLVTSSVYGVVRRVGKMEDDVAQFLAGRLPPLPQMFTREDDGWTLTSPAESGGLYLPSSWREKHRRIWSRDFAETEADLPWPILPPDDNGV